MYKEEEKAEEKKRCTYKESMETEDYKKNHDHNQPALAQTMQAAKTMRKQLNQSPRRQAQTPVVQNSANARKTSSTPSHLG